MSNVGYATMSVIPSARGFGKALSDQTSSEVDSAGKSSGHRFGKAFVAAATAGVVALGALGFAGAKAGLQTASAMEQANVSFTTMLGSTKKAKSFLGDLQQFAAKTPFEFPELQTAASSLVSVGVSSKKVIPIMTSLGNATAGMGTGSEGIKRATVALQQMSAAGKITGEDLNQLRDAGVPVFDLLAAATGKSKAAVADLAQKGKLGKKELGQLFKALETGKGLERFNGLMDKQSATLAGQFSTLKDTVNQGLASVVQPWLPFIKQLLGGVSTGSAGFFDTLTKKSAELATKAGPALQRLKSDVSDLVAGLTMKDASDVGAPLEGLVAVGFKVRTAFLTIRSGATHAGDAIHGLFDLVVKGDFTGRFAKAFNVGEDSPVVDRILDIRDSVIGLFDSFKSGDGASKLAGMFSDLTSSLPAVGPSLDLFGKALKFVGEHTEEVGKVLPFLVAGFVAVKAAQSANNVVGKDSLIGMALQVGSTLTLAASNRALAASNRAVGTSQVQVTAVENTSLLARGRALIVTVAKSAAEKAAALASRAYAAAQWLVNAALTANPIGLVIVGLVALGAAIVIAWKKSETFRTIVLGAWSAIQTGVSAVVGWLKVAVPAVFSWIKFAFLKFTLVGIVIDHWGRIRSFIGVAVGGIKTTIGWFGSLPGKFSGWFGSAKSAATGKLGDLVSFVKGLPGKIVSALGNTGKLLLDSGSNIVSGLINGIRDMGGRLAGFVKQFIADHVPKPVREALKIGSPSKLMRRDVGRWIPLGIVDGIDDEAGALDKRMRDLVRTPSVKGLDSSAVASRDASSRREKTDLSEATLQRLAAILADLKLRANVSVNDVDAAMGW